MGATEVGAQRGKQVTMDAVLNGGTRDDNGSGSGQVE
jgi:hypothetical protein